MRLIGLAVVLTLSLTLAPLAAKAQQAEKVYRIGYLTVTGPHATPETGRMWGQLLEGLRDHGYVEGQNIIIERRHWEGRAE
jgi:putative ABC transport system substrate-binding protein